MCMGFVLESNCVQLVEQYVKHDNSIDSSIRSIKPGLSVINAAKDNMGNSIVGTTIIGDYPEQKFHPPVPIRIERLDDVLINHHHQSSSSSSLMGHTAATTAASSSRTPVSY